MTPPSRPQMVFSGLNHNGGRDNAEVICAGQLLYLFVAAKNVEKKKYQ